MANERVTSYGRGGAGNIGPENPQAQTGTADLVTPTLKSDLYTTGRGGSGNMARNDPTHPEVARAAQDIEAPAPREGEGPHHIGRGGAANIAKDQQGEQPKNESASSNEAKGLVEKGKEFLHKLGGKK